MIDMEPPPYNNISTTDLPDYRSIHAPGEEVLLNQPLAHENISSEHQFRTRHLLLKLGRRIGGINAPCYGKNAVIEGTVLVRSFKHVEEISITISGKVNTVVLEHGFALMQNAQVVLFERRTLWKLRPGEAPPTEPQEYPISFPIPTYARGRTTLLPPSFSISSSTMEGSVVYGIKVDMFKTGLWRHECVTAPFYYLPRSVPTTLTSVGAAFEDVEAKAVEHPEVQWRTRDVQTTSAAVSPSPLVQLSLPLPLSYPAQMHVPFRVDIFTPVPLEPDIVLQNLSINLVKRLKIASNGYHRTCDHTLGSSTIWKMEKVEEGVWSVCGSVAGGREGEELSWTLPGFIEIKYGVQLTIQPSQGGLPTMYHHIEMVQITTHEELALDESRELPALGLLGATE